MPGGSDITRVVLPGCIKDLLVKKGTMVCTRKAQVMANG
jgi:hypothetical protein